MTASTVVAYLRYSTEDQRDGHTLQTQRDAIERYCAEHGLTLLGVYADEATSGTVEPSARAGLSSAMRAAKRGIGIVIYRVDRLSRDVGHVAAIVKWCQRGQHALHSATEGGLVDTRDPSAVTMLLMRGVLAMHERATVARRVSDALQAMRARGEHTGGPAPVGSVLVVDEARSTATATKYRVVEDAGECALLERARVLRDRGLSLRETSATLAAEGMLARCGKPIAAKVLAAALRRAA